MKLEIQHKSILSLLFIIDFLINVNFVYMYNVPWAGYFKIVIYALVWIYLNSRYAVYMPQWLKNYISIYLMIVVIETVYSIIKYDQNVSDVLKASLGYIVLIGAIIYCAYFYYYDNIEEFLDKLVVIVVILQILLLIQALLFNSGHTSVQILKALFSADSLNDSGAIHIRNGMLRCGQFNKYVYLIYYYCLYRIGSRVEKKGKYLLCVILTFINEFYVGQTRGSFIILLITTLIVLLLSMWQENHQVMFVVIVTTMILVLLFGNVIQIFIDTFVVNEVDTISIRGEATRYYLEYVKDSPILGMGIIYPVQGGRLDLWHILYGPDLIHRYSYSDIGILGAVAQYGFMAIFTHVLLFVNLIKVVYKQFIMNNKLYIFSLGFTLYMLGTCTTLLVVTNEIPLILGLFAAMSLQEDYSTNALAQ